MHTAWPAARSTLAFGQLGVSSLYPTSTRINKLCALDPADPFVACERGDVMPGLQTIGVSEQCFSQISGQFMDRTSEYLDFFHIFIVALATVPSLLSRCVCDDVSHLVAKHLVAGRGEVTIGITYITLGSEAFIATGDIFEIP